MTKDQISLLLFFECAAVDHGGLLSSQQMNKEDFEISKRWSKTGYVTLERIHSSHLGRFGSKKTHCVKLSEEAHIEAGKQRLERAKRGWASRAVLTVSEANEAA